MKLVCHVHTNNSIDSNNTLESIYREAKTMGVDAIAVTDHDSIKASLAFKEMYSGELICITGAEYSTTIGHILVLFIEEGLENILTRNDDGLYDFVELAKLAREKDAMIVAAHPKGIDDAYIEYLDGLEVFNARVLDHSRNRRAEKLAKDKGLIAFGGADAHVFGELSNCYMEISSECETLEQLKKAIENGGVGKIVCKTGNYHQSARSQLIKMKRLKMGINFYWFKQVLKWPYSVIFYIIKMLNKDDYYYKIGD